MRLPALYQVSWIERPGVANEWRMLSKGIAARGDDANDICAGIGKEPASEDTVPARGFDDADSGERLGISHDANSTGERPLPQPGPDYSGSSSSTTSVARSLSIALIETRATPGR